MKKIVLIISVLILSSFGAIAQDSIKVNFGLMLNPQAELKLKSTSEGFSSNVPLFVIMPIEIGNWSVTPIYSLTDNAIGGFVTCSLFKDKTTNTYKANTYIVGIKSIKCSDLYLGLGAGIPVFQKMASMFIEIGSLKNEFDPKIFIGLSIPFLL